LCLRFLFFLFFILALIWVCFGCLVH
jgi:hypothetical protein